MSITGQMSYRCRSKILSLIPYKTDSITINIPENMMVIDSAYMRFTVFTSEEDISTFKYQLLNMESTIREKTRFSSIVKISETQFDAKGFSLLLKQFVKQENRIQNEGMVSRYEVINLMKHSQPESERVYRRNIHEIRRIEHCEFCHR